MKCNNCGNDNPNGFIFCVNCGNRLDSQQTCNTDIPQQPPQSGYPQQNHPGQPPYYPPPQNGYQQPYYPPQQPNYHYARQASAESAATTALVFGILSFFIGGFFGVIVCLILSIVFYTNAKSQGYIGSKALVGLILSIIGTAFWIFIILLMILVSF